MNPQHSQEYSAENDSGPAQDAAPNALGLVAQFRRPSDLTVMTGVTSGSTHLPTPVSEPSGSAHPRGSTSASASAAVSPQSSPDLPMASLREASSRPFEAARPSLPPSASESQPRQPSSAPSPAISPSLNYNYGSAQHWVPQSRSGIPPQAPPYPGNQPQPQPQPPPQTQLQASSQQALQTLGRPQHDPFQTQRQSSQSMHTRMPVSFRGAPQFPHPTRSQYGTQAQLVNLRQARLRSQSQQYQPQFQAQTQQPAQASNPNPPSNSQQQVQLRPLPPQVVQIAANALCQGQALFEQAWHTTSTQVQAEIGKMFTQFSSHIAQDHAGINQLRGEYEALRGQLTRENEAMKALKAENERLCRDVKDMRARVESLEVEKAGMIRGMAANVRVQWESELLKKEVQILRTLANDGTDRQDNAGRETYELAMDSMRRELSDQLEMKAASLLAEVQDQKLKRVDAERKLAGVQQQLRAIANSALGPLRSTSPSREVQQHYPSPSRSAAHRPSQDRSSSDTVVGTPTVPDIIPKLEDPFDGPLYTMPATPTSIVQDLVPAHSTTGTISEEIQSPSRRDSTDSVGLQSLMGHLDIDRRMSVEGTAGSPEGNRRKDSEGERSEDNRPSKRMRMSLEDGEIREQPVEDEDEDEEDVKMGVETAKRVDAVKEAPVVDQSNDQPASPVVERSNKLPGPNIQRRGIGIHHMDLLYDTKRNSMVCRMCDRNQHSDNPVPPTSFPLNATWPQLVGHCQSEHPEGCTALEKLSPAEVQELRQRLKSV